MNDHQTYKPEKAIQNIEDALRLQNKTNLRILAIGLRVAGDYCNEIARELGKDNGQ